MHRVVVVEEGGEHSSIGDSFIMRANIRRGSANDAHRPDRGRGRGRRGGAIGTASGADIAATPRTTATEETKTKYKRSRPITVFTLDNIKFPLSFPHLTSQPPRLPLYNNNRSKSKQVTATPSASNSNKSSAGNGKHVEAKQWFWSTIPTDQSGARQWLRDHFLGTSATGDRSHTISGSGYPQNDVMAAAAAKKKPVRPAKRDWEKVKRVNDHDVAQKQVLAKLRWRSSLGGWLHVIFDFLAEDDLCRTCRVSWQWCRDRSTEQRSRQRWYIYNAIGMRTFQWYINEDADRLTRIEKYNCEEEFGPYRHNVVYPSLPRRDWVRWRWPLPPSTSTESESKPTIATNVASTNDGSIELKGGSSSSSSSPAKRVPTVFDGWNMSTLRYYAERVRDIQWTPSEEETAFAITHSNIYKDICKAHADDTWMDRVRALDTMYDTLFCIALHSPSAYYQCSWYDMV
jgi:hypothetical protein